MNIEDRLREWDEQERRPNTPAGIPVERLETSSSHRRRFILVGAAAAVGLIAAGIVVIQSRSPRPPPTSGAISSSAATTSASRPAIPGTPASQPPAGLQSVTFHGLTVQVPATWTLNKAECGTAVANTVIIGDGATAAYALVPPARVTSVNLSSLSKDRRIPSGTQRAITIGPVAGTRVDGTLDGIPATEVVLPAITVDLVIESPTRSGIETLVATLQINSTDVVGCAAQSARTELVAASTPAAAPLIPGTPKSVVACRYLSDFLEEGRSVASAAVASFATTINALPERLSEANKNDYLPSLCHGQPSPPINSDEEEYVVRVGYADGQVRMLHARLGLCGNLGISDGARGGQRTDALTRLLSGVAGNAVGWPGDVHPAN